jgi:hypothetical protein
MRQEHIAYSATTDGQGRFRVEDVNEGAYTATYRLRSAFLVPAICAVAGKLI